MRLLRRRQGRRHDVETSMAGVRCGTRRIVMTTFHRQMQAPVSNGRPPSARAL